MEKKILSLEDNVKEMDSSVKTQPNRTKKSKNRKTQAPRKDKNPNITGIEGE